MSTELEAMQKELLLDRKNGFFEVTDDEIQTADAFCEEYQVFLNTAKT